ncbi:thiamine-phosphate kinase [Brevibacterium luteolum]|uniref:thiamine-phosphate kinase n=1 Tax=Brevibacterium luteolum TaxID=199591 RepID=UPI001C22F11B|nr:thiamine-phosphate kinase [Brevibacterium luteolum]MBU8579341.1 thiamine-phosphate kinase [Brevibacterium luteolum]
MTSPAPGTPPVPPGAVLGDVGEDGVLSALLAALPAAGPEVRVGPGDDAAVSTLNGALVSTTDMLVEGEDFLPAWTDPHRLGIKAAAQNLADVHAMGAAPHGMLLTIGAPADTPLSFARELMTGFAEETARGGAQVLGGDLSGGPVVIISVTALGTLTAHPPVLRSGAQPGDAIVLAGTVGRAAAGLDLLLADPDLADTSDPALREPIDVQRSPRPDYAAAARIAGRAHAMIDVSDGLAGDLGRIAAASHITADLDPSALDALAAPLQAAADHLGAGASPRDWVLHGGEDHGFLATVPAGQVPVGWMRIGTCRAGNDGGGVTMAGQPVTGGSFRHFG